MDSPSEAVSALEVARQMEWQGPGQMQEQWEQLQMDWNPQGRS
jgi:hypothetical protein